MECVCYTWAARRTCGAADPHIRAKGHTMADVKIRTRPNGPFLVEGGFTLVDSEGKEFKLDPNKNYALCRCGHSSKKPFCDGTHKTCGFIADERAPDPEPA